MGARFAVQDRERRAREGQLPYARDDVAHLGDPHVQHPGVMESPPRPGTAPGSVRETQPVSPLPGSPDWSDSPLPITIPVAHGARCSLGRSWLWFPKLGAHAI
ncbi:hypothetical protein Sfulv_54080 [Streptomyces fulvorobeus]|uniref:Uncharacterized protein n=1 Tax=Streptomyces fulvorobeus TaxID=284028 RepID=A0A7J0CEC4_9ACTN|nr:hypothetical protein Sfulv_54080 [Streptomyces fulvorobeus]